MGKRLYSLTVRGRQHEWSFDVRLDPQYFDDWELDGLDLCEVANTIPQWIDQLGFAKLWCWLQDERIIPL